VEPENFGCGLDHERPTPHLLARSDLFFCAQSFARECEGKNKFKWNLGFHSFPV